MQPFFFCFFFVTSFYVWHNPIQQNKCLRFPLCSILFFHEFLIPNTLFLYSQSCHFKMDHLCCVPHFEVTLHKSVCYMKKCKCKGEFIECRLLVGYFTCFESVKVADSSKSFIWIIHQVEKRQYCLIFFSRVWGMSCCAVGHEKYHTANHQKRCKCNDSFPPFEVIIRLSQWELPSFHEHFHIMICMYTCVLLWYSISWLTLFEDGYWLELIHFLFVSLFLCRVFTRNVSTSFNLNSSFRGSLGFQCCILVTSLTRWFLFTIDLYSTSKWLILRGKIYSSRHTHTRMSGLSL